MPKITPQPSAKLVKLFQRFGFTISKRKPGDHILLRKEGCPRPLVIPDDRDVPVFVIKNNLRTANIPREAYLRKLKKI